jgi:hypothetical protein
MFAFIRPVMMSAEGALRRDDKVHTRGAPHLGNAADTLLNLLGGDKHQVCKPSITVTTCGRATPSFFFWYSL